ncbi:MAG: hypothetical protein ACE5F2_02860 [Candidatus Paceibacteria bacterium]
MSKKSFFMLCVFLVVTGIILAFLVRNVNYKTKEVDFSIVEEIEAKETAHKKYKWQEGFQHIPNSEMAPPKRKGRFWI